MRKILIIARREYSAAVRTKAFIISLVLMPVMMGGSIMVQVLMKDKVDTTDKKVALVDHSGQLAEVLVQAAEERNATRVLDPQTGKKVRPAFLFKPVAPNAEDPKAQRLELSGKVETGEYSAFVEIGREVLNPGKDAEAARVGYHSQNPLYDDIRQFIAGPINNQVHALRFAETKIDRDTVSRLIAAVPVESLGLVSVDAATGAIKDAQRSNEGAALLLPMGLMMLMFMLVMMGSTPLINSVLEEKMQRIAEVLLGSARPFTLMMGKLLGTVGVSLTVLAVYIGGAVVAAERMGAGDRVPWNILPWFFAYQVSAILLFGAIFIAIGSACNDIKEAQSLMMPIWLLLCAPMFVWFNVVREPLSGFATAMSLIPPFTPMLMLLRQTTPMGVPAWQPWIGLVGVMLTTTLCVWAAGRIFRVGLLMQGKPPKLRELARWAITG